jgi:hypothetical protein
MLASGGEASSLAPEEAAYIIGYLHGRQSSG